MSTTPHKNVVKASTIIARSALFEQLLGSLRDMILEGQLPEGSRIAEPELCERFGTSRTPLREAFKVLASEGLVELQTFRGAFVARISEAEAKDVSFMLSTLEQAAVKLLANSAPDAALAQLQTLHKTMVSAASRKDLVSYQTLNEAVHAKFVELTGNSILIDSYGRIKNRLLRVRRARPRSPDDLKRAIDDHNAMMKALAARDGIGAASIIERHYKELL
ncbi:MAG: GntR family transcriptional regulator [Dokdonella sp.]